MLIISVLPTFYFAAVWKYILLGSISFKYCCVCVLQKLDALLFNFLYKILSNIILLLIGQSFNIIFIRMKETIKSIIWTISCVTDLMCFNQNGYPTNNNFAGKVASLHNTFKLIIYIDYNWAMLTNLRHTSWFLLHKSQTSSVCWQ